MAKTKLDGVDLVAVIEAAGEADLAAIEQRIVELRKEMDDFVSTRKRKLDALTLVKKSLQFKLHGRPAKSDATGDGKTGSGGTKLAERIYELISEQGSMPVPAIAEAVGVRAAGVGICVSRSPWFERRNGEVYIAVRKS
jgi:hypothetical protein